MAVPFGTLTFPQKQFQDNKAADEEPGALTQSLNGWLLAARPGRRWFRR
jgi:hypothetical protein